MSRPNVADWQYLGVDEFTQWLEWNSGRKARKGHICENTFAYVSNSSKDNGMQRRKFIDDKRNRITFMSSGICFQLKISIRFHILFASREIVLTKCQECVKILILWQWKERDTVLLDRQNRNSYSKHIHVWFRYSDRETASLCKAELLHCMPFQQWRTTVRIFCYSPIIIFSTSHHITQCDLSHCKKICYLQEDRCFVNVSIIIKSSRY